MKKRKKINKPKVALLIVILFFLILLILSTIKIIKYLHDNKENSEIKKVVSEAITIDTSDEANEIYKIDFQKLKEQNPDTVAYLKVNNTNIDYVVVKGNDNSYYLNHNFNKHNNVSGWIFADYHNKFDGSDKNIIIYGHNTMDGSMFGTLKNVLNKEWYQDENNHKIMLIIDNKILYYEVFSTYTITAEDYYINTKFNSDSEFETFIKRLKFRSDYPYKINVYKDDKILTLSTCTADGKKRVVLHARLLTN